MSDNWDDAPVSVPQKIAEIPEIKLFGKWNCDDVQVSDMSLQVCNFQMSLNMFLQCLIIFRIILL